MVMLTLSSAIAGTAVAAIAAASVIASVAFLLMFYSSYFVPYLVVGISLFVVSFYHCIFTMSSGYHNFSFIKIYFVKIIRLCLFCFVHYINYVFFEFYLMFNKIS